MIQTYRQEEAGVVIYVTIREVWLVEIKKVGRDDLPEAVDIMWTTFLKFEAPDYPAEGVEPFKDFIENEDMMLALEVLGAYDEGELKGVIAVDVSADHICCFFVKGEYHRQGIGKKLWEYFLDNSTGKTITVNSSPFAVPFYHDLGFEDTDDEQLTDGMRYTPMRFERI